MKYFDHQGFPIAYQSLEQAYPKNVLFIHGNLASKEWWFPTMEILSQSKGPGKLIAADWRGYGDSKGITERSQIDFEQFAADFVALIEDQNMKDVQVIGHSTGGLIAMLAVLQRPDLFESLTLLDSVGAKGLELPHPKDQVLAHFEKMSLDKDYCKVVLAATIKGCTPEDPKFLPLLEKTWAADRPMFQGVVDVLSDQVDYREEIKGLKLPTLILHGDQDAVLPLSTAEELKALLPHSTLQIVPGHGHSLNMEDPQKLAQICEAFWL